MARKERGRSFDSHEPSLDPDEAMAALRAGRAAISLKAIPCLADSGAIEYVAVKFALVNGGFATVLLDGFAASAMREAIDAADQAQWDGNTLKTGPSAH